MKHSILLVIFCLHWQKIASDNKQQNKTKRGLIDQTHYFGQTFRPISLYADNSVANTQPQPGLSNYYIPKYNVKQNYETEPKVTTQQVLYEYQQTPHNTVSNVHVNQQYQSVPTTQQHQQQQQQPHTEQQVAYTNQYITQQPQVQQPQNNHYHQYTPTESHVNPVQHSTIIQHTPYIHNPQNPYIIGKYLYMNGKVIYNPQPIPNQQIHQQPQLQQYNVQPQPHQLYMQAHHPLQQRQQLQKLPQVRLTPPPPVRPPPITYQNHPVEKSTPKPVPAPVREEAENEDVEQEEDEEEKANVQVQEEEEEDGDEEKSNIEAEEEEDEDDRQPYHRSKDFGRYTFEEEEEDDDHEKYKESDEEKEDEDDDTREGSSRYHHIKEPKKYKSSYQYKEGHKRSSHSNKPITKKSKSKPKSHYQAYTFSKGPNGKPKIEIIQGKSSQQVPVTVQKVYKEKWYITRNTNPRATVA